MRDNVCYNNARAQIELSGFESYDRTGRKDNLPQNHTITDNVLFAAAKGQATISSSRSSTTASWAPTTSARPTRMRPC